MEKLSQFMEMLSILKKIKISITLVLILTHGNAFAQRQFFSDSTYCEKDTTIIGESFYYYNAFENVIDSVISMHIDVDSIYLSKIKIIAKCNKDRSLNGLVKGFNGKDLLFSINYDNGLANGTFVMYNKDDTSYFATLKNGKREGLCAEYYGSKNTSNVYIEYRNGVRDGFYIINKNNRLKYFVNYKNGEKHGAEYLLYENGRLRYFQRNENGKVKDGRYDGFDYDGNIEEEYYIENGLLIQKICYDSEGNVVKCLY